MFVIYNKNSFVKIVLCGKIFWVIKSYVNIVLLFMKRKRDCNRYLFFECDILFYKRYRIVHVLLGVITRRSLIIASLSIREVLMCVHSCRGTLSTNGASSTLVPLFSLLKWTVFALVVWTPKQMKRAPIKFTRVWNLTRSVITIYLCFRRFGLTFKICFIVFCWLLSEHYKFCSWLKFPCSM